MQAEQTLLSSPPDINGHENHSNSNDHDEPPPEEEEEEEEQQQQQQQRPASSPPPPPATTASSLSPEDDEPNNHKDQKSVVEQLIDPQKVRLDIDKLHTFKLEQDEEWKETADEVVQALAKLRARWKELDQTRKQINKLLKPTKEPGTRGPGRPGRRAKRQKVE